MSKYFRITKDNEASLRKRSEIVSNPMDEEIISLVNKMHDYLVASQDHDIRERYHMREGVGLAAPQIGKNIRALVVYYPDEYDENDKPVHFVDHRLVNPKIIAESIKEVALRGGEGCLSVDNEHEGYVYRKAKITVRAFSVLDLKEVTFTVTGYEAIVLQHEIDHLNGVLFYDHIDKINPNKDIPGAVEI